MLPNIYDNYFSCRKMSFCEDFNYYCLEYAFYRSIIVQKLGGCWGILNVFKKFKIYIIYTKLKLKLKFLLLIRVGIGEIAQQGPMMWLAYSVEWYGLLRKKGLR